MKDLRPMMDEIVEIMKSHGMIEPAVAIAFTIKQENYKMVHWATNVKRAHGIKLFKETANKMISQTN